MKLYRAVFSYNNGDYDEWEEWFKEVSPWYEDRTLAEQHLPQLQQFKEYLIYYHRNCYSFDYKEPKVEEIESINVFKPLNIKFKGEEFKGFSYIPYKGSYTITKRTLSSLGRTLDEWRFIIEIEGERFSIYFNINDNREAIFSVFKETEDSKFYNYNPEVREGFFKKCREVANTVFPFFKKLAEDDKVFPDNWDAIRELKLVDKEAILKARNIISALNSLDTCFLIGNGVISELKYDIENHWMCQDYPEYKQALQDLVKALSRFRTTE